MASSDKTPEVEYLRLSQKYFDHPGFQIESMIRIQSMLFDIYQGNRDELLASIEIFEDFDKANSLMSDHSLRAKRLGQTIRLLHNFVSASKTLVDLTRNRVRRAYAQTPFHDQYERRVRSTFHDVPAIAFVHDLRNYFLHHEVVLLIAIIGISQKGREETFVKFNIDALKTYQKWTKHARQYIEEIADEPDLRRAVEDYDRRVSPFQSWLLQKHREINRDVLAELDGLRNQLSTIKRGAA